MALNSPNRVPTKEILKSVYDTLGRKIPTACNQNLLDNWYFGYPVNRKGLNNYPALESVETAFFIDRWIYGKGLANGVLLGTDGLTIAHRSGEYNFIAQPQAEGYLEQLRGKIVTISALVKGSGHVFIGTVNGPRSTSLLTDSFSVCSNTFEWPKEANKWTDQPSISVDEGTIATVNAMKLEFGSEQTLAHKVGDAWVLTEIPNHSEQYNICRNYDRETGEFIQWRFIGD